VRPAFSLSFFLAAVRDFVVNVDWSILGKWIPALFFSFDLVGSRKCLYDVDFVVESGV
jgi:hypothetical protein